jgi:HAD superfamily hydrolase (TIGR01490 family)
MLGVMEAAFFDLDKTVIAKASMMAFGRSFYRAGLISRRSLAKGLWTQVTYVRIGASAKKVARIRHSVLRVTRGWEQARVREIVADGLVSLIDPITYSEARALIDEHRAAGRRVYIVSAAPAEIVEPLAHHFGVHEAIASQARVDHHGRYTGHLDRYAYGPAKAALIRQIAERDGLDLSRSWAYTDSATDLPMLEVVGHPVAVNPDRALRRIARMRGWETQRFEHLVQPAPAERAVTGRAVTGQAVTGEAASAKAAVDQALVDSAGVGADPARGAAAAAGAARESTRNGRGRWNAPAWAVLAAATGGITAWWWTRRGIQLRSS